MAWILPAYDVMRGFGMHVYCDIIIDYVMHDIIHCSITHASLQVSH